MNEKILAALEESLKRIQRQIAQVGTLPAQHTAKALLFCKSEDLKLAVAAQKATMEMEKGG
jgi:hypothetical protein